MNICFLDRLFFQYKGGIESYTCQMAKALAKEGHTVHIVAEAGREQFNLNGLPENVHIHKIQFNKSPFRGYWRFEKVLPLNYLRYAWAVAGKMKELFKEYTIDIVEAPDCFGQALWHVFNKTKPLIIRLHGGFYLFKIDSYLNKVLVRSLKGRLLWALERISMLNADGLSAVSGNLSGVMKETFKLNGKKIAIIHNGINQDIFKAGDNSFRQSCVLFVGSLEERKGIGTLARAIPIVLKACPETTFCFAGRIAQNKNENESWKDYILRYAPGEKLSFLGQLETEELIYYYQTSQVCVFPSVYEPFGLVALESMACGCATVAASSGGFPEIIRDGIDGLLVPPQNPEKLAFAIIQLLQNQSLSGTLANNAMNRIREKFDIAEKVRETVAFYEKTIIELPLSKYNFKSPDTVNKTSGRFEVGKGKLNNKV